MQIGEICNYYGGLEVKEEGGRFYWAIENHDGHDWEQIPQYLYDALVKYESERLIPEPEKYLSLAKLKEIISSKPNYTYVPVFEELIAACEELPNQKEQ